MYGDWKFVIYTFHSYYMVTLYRSFLKQLYTFLFKRRKIHKSNNSQNVIKLVVVMFTYQLNEEKKKKNFWFYHIDWDKLRVI